MNVTTIFVIGLVKVVIGISFLVKAKKTSTDFVSSARLMSEGVGGMKFAVECAFREHCTWKEYEKMKDINMKICAVVQEISTTFCRDPQVPTSVTSSATLRNVAEKIGQITKTTKMSSSMYKTAEHNFRHYLKEISKAMLPNTKEKILNHSMNEKLTKLTRQIGPDKTRVIITRINEELLDAARPHDSLVIMQGIYDKVAEVVTSSADAAKNHSMIEDSTAGMIDSIVNWTRKGVLVTKELAELSDTLLSLIDSKLEKELERFEDQIESFHENAEFEQEIREQWQDLVVKKMNEQFISEVVKPTMRYFRSVQTTTCSQEIISQYRERATNQCRRIFDSSLDNLQNALNHRESLHADGESIKDKYNRQTNVHNAIKMKLQRNLEDLMHETQDPDLMAAICTYDIAVPMLMAKPLAVKLGRPIVVRDPGGSTIQRFSHCGVDNAEPIEITYRKGVSEKSPENFYSTKFEDPPDRKKNQDCFLRAINAAVANDEMITRQELADFLKADKHMRDLIRRRNHQGDFSFIHIDKRRRRQLKLEPEQHIRDAPKKVHVIIFLFHHVCVLQFF